jgi:hypothetical protein
MAGENGENKKEEWRWVISHVVACPLKNGIPMNPINHPAP